MRSCSKKQPFFLHSKNLLFKPKAKTAALPCVFFWNTSIRQVWLLTLCFCARKFFGSSGHFLKNTLKLLQISMQIGFYGDSPLTFDVVRDSKLYMQNMAFKYILKKYHRVFLKNFIRAQNFPKGHHSYNICFGLKTSYNKFIFFENSRQKFRCSDRAFCSKRTIQKNLINSSSLKTSITLLWAYFLHFQTILSSRNFLHQK